MAAICPTPALAFEGDRVRCRCISFLSAIFFNLSFLQFQRARALGRQRHHLNVARCLFLAGTIGFIAQQKTYTHTAVACLNLFGVACLDRPNSKDALLLVVVMYSLRSE